MQEDRLTRFAHWMGRIVPDALSSSIILMVVLVVAAFGLGNTVETTMDAYYRGLWMLLPFTMQMTLILLLSSVLSSTPFFKSIVVGLSKVPKNQTQVIVLAVALGSFMAYLYWGLSIALAPLIAIHFAREAERKGIATDFPFLLAVMVASGSVWQYGFSASGPLLMATKDHFLFETTGTLPLSTTIWAPASIILTVTFPIALMITARILSPSKPQLISQFPEAYKIAEPAPVPEIDATAEKVDAGTLNASQRLEHSRWILIIPCIALVAWLYQHFIVKDLSLDPNALNTTLLILCFLLHGTIHKFSKALQEAVHSCWAILVLYHLYAGVAGLIQYTSVGETFARAFAAISTEYTFPLLTAISGSIVAVFVPSSGGQWAIQGFVTTTAAHEVGVSYERGLLALGVGDQMGNLISPFWAVVTAGIARIEFRKFFGYCLVFAAVWFVLGVLAFTFLPC